MQGPGLHGIEFGGLLHLRAMVVDMPTACLLQTHSSQTGQRDAYKIVNMGVYRYAVSSGLFQEHTSLFAQLFV